LVAGQAIGATLSGVPDHGFYNEPLEGNIGCGLSLIRCQPAQTLTGNGPDS
jgi:hypothetical protein